MQSQRSLQFTTNDRINRLEWDKCICGSAHGLIYATSMFLDNMCTHWRALIGENYNWVMPVAPKRKYGLDYLYQPPFTQQLGVFAKPGTMDIPWAEITRILEKQYRFWEINLNYATPLPVLQALDYTKAANFILSLQGTYETIAGNYHTVLKKNLKRSQHYSLVYRGTDHLACIEAYKQQYGNRLRHVTAGDYQNFGKVCDHLLLNSRLICREVVDRNERMLGNILLLSDGRRLYNIMNTTMPDTKKIQANHFLLDGIIKEFAGKDLILDFEGSDLSGVKAFYESFGAINQPYFKIRYNHLPWPANLFK